MEKRAWKSGFYHGLGKRIRGNFLGLKNEKDLLYLFIAENPESNPNPLTARQRTSKREEDYQGRREEEDPDYQDVTKREEEDPDYQGVRGMWGKRTGNGKGNGNGKAKMVNIRRWGKRGGRGWKRGKILRGMWGKRSGEEESATKPSSQSPMLFCPFL